MKKQSNCEQTIVQAVLLLIQGDVEAVFSVKDICDKLDLSQATWLEEYDACFQRMCLNYVPKEKEALSEFAEIFQKQRHGYFGLSIVGGMKLHRLLAR